MSSDRLARGKQSIAVDIKKPEGLDIVRKMCSRADVLIEPFRPGSVSCAIIFRFMVFNATFNNISLISWLSVLLVEETRGRVSKENHRPVTSH